MLNLRKCGHKDLERYYSLLEMDFAKEEIISKLILHRALLNGSAELLVVYDEESNLEVAYALVLTKNLYGYVLLKYMAVLPWYRGKGVGIAAMRLINKRYADRQGIIAELTSFEDEDGSMLKSLRKFFSRFGFVRIDSDYRIGGSPVELMVKPIKGTFEIEPVEHRIIRDFYTRVLNPFTMDKMIDIRPVKKQGD